MTTTAARPAPSRAVPVAWWLVVGALLGLGAVSILTIGILLLLAGLAMTLGGLLWARTRTTAASLAVTGAGLAPIWVGWLNRAGPGTLCETSAATTSCAELFSPWPWVLVGLALVATGLTLWATTRSRPAPPSPRLT